MFAVSSFNENSSRGAIMLRALPGSANDKSFRRYWGFNGLKKKRRHSIDNTLAPGLTRNIEKTSKKQPSDAIVGYTPLVVTKGGSSKQTTTSVRKVTPAGDTLTPAPSPKSSSAKADKSSRPSKKQKRPTEEEHMDS